MTGWHCMALPIVKWTRLSLWWSICASCASFEHLPESGRKRVNATERRVQSRLRRREDLRTMRRSRQRIQNHINSISDILLCEIFQRTLSLRYRVNSSVLFAILTKHEMHESYGIVSAFLWHNGYFGCWNRSHCATPCDITVMPECCAPPALLA